MSDQNILTQALTNTLISRRTFLKWSAVLGGTAALASGGVNVGLTVGCRGSSRGSRTQRGEMASGGVLAQLRRTQLEQVRTSSMAWSSGKKRMIPIADSPDFPQQRGCARGRSQRHRVFGADRLRYPMKRAHWSPGGGDKSLRGRDEWVRISWDEALTILANETIRIKEKYGNKAIYNNGSRSLNLFGGAVTSWGSTSSGTWAATAPRIAGDYILGNDRLELRKSKLIVMWSTDTFWVSAGSPTWNYYNAKKAGAKFIFVDPFYNNTAQILADEWIPIRPGTDTPMLLAIGHTLITEDDPKDKSVDRLGFRQSLHDRL